MTEQSPESDASDLAGDPESYGGLSIEDDPGGTIDPAELAGTADESDATVAYAPQHNDSEAPPPV